jgi:CubicO group peptidase (beta-lactamase class C family)
MANLPRSPLADTVNTLATASGFSGCVRVDRGDETEVDAAFGLADRRHGIAMTTGTRLGIASGTKTFTALAVMSLVVEGSLSLDTRVREVLGRDLPLVDDRVTVEHLLSHRSGIGDYFDEEAFPDSNDHALTVPVHTLATTEDYLPVLDGLAQVSEPGSTFTYNNGAFVVLAIVAGRVAGRPFEQLLVERVCEPAGMASTAFLRTDELPGDVATGYLFDTGLRSNALHLPVLGSGDGGLYSTTGDVAAFWRALLAGRVVPTEVLADMWRPRSAPEGERAYGLGFWCGPGPAVGLLGADAGVSFRSVHDPRSGVTWTVVSNTSDGAWPMARGLAEHLDEARPGQA